MMRLAMYGSLSSSSFTKHLRDYFVKDTVEEGNIDIKYCPTEKMWSNILNKPKQGATFKKDGAILMNAPVEYDDQIEF